MASGEATTRVFQSIGQTLENATQTFVNEKVADLISTIEPMALGGVALYITFLGYLIIFGAGDDPAKALMVKIAKIMFVAGIALNADNYLTYVVGVLTNLQDGLATAFSGKTGTTIYSALDNSLSKGFELILKCREQASQAGWSEWGTAFGWWVIALLVGIGLALVVVVGGVTLLMSTIYLKILFAIGPFFVMALFWPITARFFDSWVGYVFNHILIVSLTAVVLAFGIAIYDHEISKVVMDSDQNMLLVSLELLIVAAIMYGITKGITGMAAALAGGLQMAVMDVGGLLRQAMGGYRTAKAVGGAVASGGAAAAKQGANLARHLADRFSGNKISPGNGGGAWQPAFRRHLYGAIGARNN